MAREAGVLSPHARAARALLTGYALFIYLFLFAPIAILVLFSFNANQYATFPITGWTAKWYHEVFGDYEIRDALWTTLKVAAWVTLVSTVLGTAAAFPLVRSRLRFAGALFAFTLSFDEFVITYFIIGSANTLPIYIYTRTRFGIDPEVNALASLVLVSSILLISLAFVLPPGFRLVRRATRSARARRSALVPEAVGATEY